MGTPLILHGHFYQPPRENPWSGEIEREPSAQPFRNWTERIHHECYRPNSRARLLDDRGRLRRLYNNYTGLSFDFSPLLLAWMERHHPGTYRRILEADRASEGRGRALAHPYVHAILPLCTPRDRRTLLRWGIDDFRARFGRAPEGMWLPETACDDATLRDLIDAGIRFTLLAPSQASRSRPFEGAWAPAEGALATDRPYRCFPRGDPRGSIDIFFYDRELSGAVAFGPALASRESLLDHLARARSRSPGLVHLAVDGETFGHHYRHGEETIAGVLESAAEHEFRITTYADLLAERTPTHQVEIATGPDGLGTSWSCAHGVARWTRDCGCQAGGQAGWTQGWRTPLRKALDLLRDSAGREFEAHAGALCRDPWALRDAYLDLLSGPPEGLPARLERAAGHPLSESERSDLLALLELQRCCLLMYTSCAWFFADLSGLESLLVLRYAARALDLMRELGLPSPRNDFLAALAEARSNLGRNGADLFREEVEPRAIPSVRAAAHVALTTLLDPDRSSGSVGGYSVRLDRLQKRTSRYSLALGRVRIQSNLTLRKQDYAFAALHLDDLDLHALVLPFPGLPRFEEMSREIWKAYEEGSLAATLRILHEQFGAQGWGTEALIEPERDRLFQQVFDRLVQKLVSQTTETYAQRHTLLRKLEAEGFPLPADLRNALQVLRKFRLEWELRELRKQSAPAALSRALELMESAVSSGVPFDRSACGRVLGELLALAISGEPTVELSSLVDALVALRNLSVPPDPRPAQEALLEVRRGSRELADLAELLGVSNEVLEATRPSRKNAERS